MTIPALPIYDVADVAARLGVHRKTVLAWVRSGRLHCSAPGPRTFRFTEADIQAFLTANPFVPPTSPTAGRGRGRPRKATRSELEAEAEVIAAAVTPTSSPRRRGRRAA